MYLAVAWLLLQVADTIGPTVGLSLGVQKLLLIVLAIGFPVAIMLAWVLELTPAGVKIDNGHTSPDAALSRRLDKTITVVLLLAVVYFVGEKAFLEDPQSVSDPVPSVAVLPLVNLSRDNATDPFARGIHDDLLTQLSRIKTLRIVSRTSVMRYQDTTKTVPEIAAELGVSIVVEGGVQRSGNRVRINIQLIDAALDEHLWAETYDRELTAANVFDIQSDIARSIAKQLRATLTVDDVARLGRVPTQNIVALETYFVGKRLLEDRTRESLTAAVEFFEKVVELDPDFALGWSGLADAYMLLPEYSPTVDRELVGRKSREAIARALALDPDIPEVRSSEAWHQLIHHYDWQGAEQTFNESLDVVSDNPNVLHWLSHTLSWQGRFDEAIDVARRAVAADPDSRMMRTNLAYILVDAAQFEEGLEVAWGMYQEAPDYTVQRRNLFLHELRAGRIRNAADTFVAYTEMIGGDADSARRIGEQFIRYEETGKVGHLTPEMIRGAQLGTEDLAQVLAFVGDGEGTIAALAEAIESRSGSRSVLSMRINPAYDFIRDDPRFIAMLKEVGLGD